MYRTTCSHKQSTVKTCNGNRIFYKRLFSYALGDIGRIHGGIIMINRVCSYCGSNTGYDDDKKSKGYWYSLVTRDNKTCLYFVCSNCYAKQTDKYLEWNPIIINTKSQNRNEVEHKTKNFCHNPILT